MLLFQLKLYSDSRSRKELIEILELVRGNTLLIQGCISCEIYAGIGSDSTVMFMEFWESSPILLRHIRSDAYTRLLTAIELSSSTPEIKFFEIGESWGLDLIESVRNPLVCSDPPDQNTSSGHINQ